MASATDTSSKEQQSFSMKMVIYGVKKRFPSVSNITCDEFDKLRQQSQELLCLDSRDLQEFAVSHISGATRVDHESDEPWSGVELLNIKNVVCYCSVGYRSSIVAEKLKQFLRSQGRKDVKIYNLEGGVFQWAIEGRELEGERKTQVHPYSMFWGKLLPSHLRHSNL